MCIAPRVAMASIFKGIQMLKPYVAPAFVKVQNLSAVTAAPPPPVTSGYVPLG